MISFRVDLLATVPSTDESEVLLGLPSDVTFGKGESRKNDAKSERNEREREEKGKKERRKILVVGI